MVRPPSIEDHVNAASQNWKVFLTGFVGGCVLTATVLTFLSSPNKELLANRLAQANDTIHNQAEQLTKDETEAKSLRDQLSQTRDAATEREAKLKVQLAQAIAHADGAIKTENELKPQVTELRRKMDAAGQTIETLTRRNEKLQQQITQAADEAANAAKAKNAEISPISSKILLELFKSPNLSRSVEELASKLKMGVGPTQYYVDILVDAGLIDDSWQITENDMPIARKEIYQINAKGRGYVMDHGLITK